LSSAVRGDLCPLAALVLSPWNTEFPFAAAVLVGATARHYAHFSRLLWAVFHSSLAASPHYQWSHTSELLLLALLLVWQLVTMTFYRHL
jgi:hypothetical protein